MTPILFGFQGLFEKRDPGTRSGTSGSVQLTETYITVSPITTLLPATLGAKRMATTAAVRSEGWEGCQGESPTVIRSVCSGLEGPDQGSSWRGHFLGKKPRRKDFGGEKAKVCDKRMSHPPKSTD